MNDPIPSAVSRRNFLRSAGAATAGGVLLGGINSGGWLAAQEPGSRPKQDAGVSVLNPRGRVPMSFIIDDSTCLVNLAHFCIPHFAEVYPDRYKQDWRKLPREIPDAFVENFAGWCHEHGVKGKYSIVPYPACVGWMDRDVPGWTYQELQNSLELVRRQIVPDWDIHPEMITHTWAINTKTGRPYEERSEKFMENWGWSVNLSADQMADYLGYALKVLKNAGLHCEGVTTPGGFGSRSRPALAQGCLDACRDVFNVEIPHYFRDLFVGNESVAPQVFYAGSLDSDNPRCVVSVIGCTGDWFGGWDGLEAGSVDRFITADLKGGRLPQVIDRGEPAILVCHWPGIYFNGEEIGFKIFKEVVARLNARYDHLRWMKLSEIARYWAAKELTTIRRTADTVELAAPFASPDFTLAFAAPEGKKPALVGADGKRVALEPVADKLKLEPGTYWRKGEQLTVCFDLPKGASKIVVA